MIQYDAIVSAGNTPPCPLFVFCLFVSYQTGMKSAQDGLFNRIADSFVALFFGVDQEYKDRFFQVAIDFLFC